MGEAKRRKDYQEGVTRAITAWKEVNPKMELKVLFAGNATLIGEYEAETKTLKRPRALASGVDSQGRQVVAMQMVIGEPDEIEILNPSLMFDVKDEKVVNLYIQAVTGIVPARDLSNVLPIKGGNGKGGKLPPLPPPLPQMMG